MKITTAFLLMFLCLVAVEPATALNGASVKVSSARCCFMEGALVLDFTFARYIPEGQKIQFRFKTEKPADSYVRIVLSPMVVNERQVMNAEPRMNLNNPPYSGHRDVIRNSIPFNNREDFERDGGFDTAMLLRVYPRSGSPIYLFGTINLVPGPPFSVRMYIPKEDSKYLESVVMQPGSDVLLHF